MINLLLGPIMASIAMLVITRAVGSMIYPPGSPSQRPAGRLTMTPHTRLVVLAAGSAALFVFASHPLSGALVGLVVFLSRGTLPDLAVALASLWLAAWCRTMPMQVTVFDEFAAES